MGAKRGQRMGESEKKRTVKESGWHLSDYTIVSKIPDTDKIGVANLCSGSFSVFSPAEAYLLSVAETLDEDHPAVERFKKHGLLVDYDELSALMEQGDPRYVGDNPVTMTICVTQSCNFDCAYCFEHHQGSRMEPEIQDGVVGLAARLLDVSGRKRLHIVWFGGEPLLAPDIIDSMSAKLMAVAKERKVTYSACIVTNGYLFTQEIVDMLWRNKVDQAVVGLDGVGSVHDDARPLLNGGPTFKKITDNLRNLRIPFAVDIRHVIHSHNRDQVDVLRDFIEKLAEESGNRIFHKPDIAHGFYAPVDRSLDVGMIEGEDALRVAVLRDGGRFAGGRGQHCGANSLWCVEIHESGALHKCWPAIDRPELSFGSVGKWDPADPYGTADYPEKLKMYLDTNLPNIHDEECLNCKWLPLCVGGCPYLRMFYKRDCVPYKDKHEQFMRGMYDRLLRSRAVSVQPDDMGGSCFSASSSKE